MTLKKSPFFRHFLTFLCKNVYKNVVNRIFLIKGYLLDILRKRIQFDNFITISWWNYIEVIPFFKEIVYWPFFFSSRWLSVVSDHLNILCPKTRWWLRFYAGKSIVHRQSTIFEPGCSFQIDNDGLV